MSTWGRSHSCKLPSARSQLVSPSFGLNMENLTSAPLHLKQHLSQTTHGCLNSPLAVEVGMRLVFVFMAFG